MSVPDWPTTYGYKHVLLFRSQNGLGGIFGKHLHRFGKRSGVGFLTVILAVWLWGEGNRGHGFAGLACWQCLRVGVAGRFGRDCEWFYTRTRLAFSTRALAQIVSGCWSACWRWSPAVGGGIWRPHFPPGGLIRENPQPPAHRHAAHFRSTSVLGATMRHQHAGLAHS